MGQLLNQCACMLSHIRLFLTPWTVAHHTPLSKEFSRQEHWSEFPRPTPGDLPNPAIQPSLPEHCQADSLPLCHLENPLKSIKISKTKELQVEKTAQPFIQLCGCLFQMGASAIKACVRHLHYKTIITAKKPTVRAYTTSLQVLFPWLQDDQLVPVAWDFSVLVGTENLGNFCEILGKSQKSGTGSLGNPSVPGLVFIPAVDTSSLSFNSFFFLYFSSSMPQSPFHFLRVSNPCVRQLEQEKGVQNGSG